MSRPPTPALIRGPEFMESNFDILVHRYLESLHIRNYSERTIEVYEGYLRIFRQYLEGQKIDDLTAVTEMNLTAYQRELFYRPTYKGTARTPTALNRALIVVKGLYRFLKAEGVVVRDPSMAIELSRRPQELPRNILTPKEAKKIVEQPDTATLIGYRDRTMLEVLYSTGLRKNELRKLKVEDVKLDEGLLFVRQGKGGKDRVVPLGQMACKYLENYIKAVRPEVMRGKEHAELFLSSWGRPIGEGTVRWVVEKYAKLSGVKKHVTCHLWRHTCATHLVQNRANLRHVQQMLGHRSLATTERYLSLTITDLKEAHSKCHPRELEKRV